MNGPFFLIDLGGRRRNNFCRFVVKVKRSFFASEKFTSNMGLGCWEWRLSNQYMLHGPSQSRQSIVLNLIPAFKREKSFVVVVKNVRFSQKVEFAQNICRLKSGRQ